MPRPSHCATACTPPAGAAATSPPTTYFRIQKGDHRDQFASNWRTSVASSTPRRVISACPTAVQDAPSTPQSDPPNQRSSPTWPAPFPSTRYSAPAPCSAAESAAYPDSSPRFQALPDASLGECVRWMQGAMPAGCPVWGWREGTPWGRMSRITVWSGLPGDAKPLRGVLAVAAASSYRWSVVPLDWGSV
jgi:hypothetical protein